LLKKTEKFGFIESIELTGATPLKESIAFCEYFGGEVTYEAEENRVYMKDIDWQKIEQMKNEGYIENNDISIEIFDEIPDAIIDDYAKAFTVIRNESGYDDVPREKRITVEKLRNF
jgi:hypothetical protein